MMTSPENTPEQNDQSVTVQLVERGDSPSEVSTGMLQCIKTHKWKVVYVCITVVLIAFLVIVVSIQGNENHRLKTEMSQRNVTLAARMSAVREQSLDGIDSRISVETSTCENPACFMCQEEIIPHHEPVTCDEKGNLKNESCFLCEEKCFTYVDLLNIVKQNKTPFTCDHRPVEVTCCVLATMGNLGRHCGNNGQHCFHGTVHSLFNKTSYEPVCICPSDNLIQTYHCDKPFTQTANCTCFKSRQKFCGQEQLLECASEKLRVNWTKCYETLIKDNAQHNCLCEKTDKERLLGLQLCKNGSF